MRRGVGDGRQGETDRGAADREGAHVAAEGRRKDPVARHPLAMPAREDVSPTRGRASSGSMAGPWLGDGQGVSIRENEDRN